ncbi:MAG: hypothetical protein NTW52_14230 [Planctomycetota bacterium]|nr:hypothetical protein [Planctomycetota bacterium]
MATTFPSKRYLASWGTVGHFAVLLIVLSLSFQFNSTSFAQGEAAESDSAVTESSNGDSIEGDDSSTPSRSLSGLASGIGNRVRGIFGSKEPPAEETTKKSSELSVRRDAGQFKPGAIRNGFAKQIRATTESDSELEAPAEEPSKASSAASKEPPKATNRVAQRPYLEPFTKPMPPNVTQPGATSTAGRATNQPPLDPPSLVGTGFRTSRDSGTASKSNAPASNTVNRFKPDPTQVASLPKTSPQMSTGFQASGGQSLTPRALPEVVSSSQSGSSSTNTTNRDFAESNMATDRQNQTSAGSFSVDPLNSRIKDPSATTRKSASGTVAVDPREDSGVAQPKPQVNSRDFSTNTDAGLDLVAESASDDGMRPVAKKSVPSTNRRESNSAANSLPRSTTAANSPAAPQATPFKPAAPNGSGYDVPSSGYPLTSQQYSGPQTPAKELVAAGPASGALNNSNANQSIAANRANAKQNSQATRGTTAASSPDSLSNAIGIPRVDMTIPKVRLMVVGPTALQVAKAVPYEVVIKNEGAEQLSGVIVSMTVPAGVTPSGFVSTVGEFETEKDDKGMETVLWHVTDLGPSQSRIFRLNLEASKPEHFAMDVEWTVLPQSGQVQISVEEPQLTLALEGPSEVLWGKPELYRLKVRNPGNATVKNVQVKLVAEAFGSNESSIGDIQPGGERIVEVELTFQQMGSIAISGQAASKTQSLEAKSKIDVSVNQIKLESEWKAPSKQYLGSVAEYQVTLHNRSTMVGENVMCSAIIPDGLSVDRLPEGATVFGKEIRWTVATIKALESMDFVFSLQANEASDAKLRFEAKSAGNGATLAEGIAVLDPIVDLKLTVIDPIAPAPVGQDVQYDMVILNRGTRPAHAVKVVAQFSNGIEPIRAEGVMGKLVPGQVIFDSIETIGPGQQITLRVVAQAAEAGVHRFRAELQCEDGETQLIEEESTRYLATSRNDSSKPIIRR